MDLEDYVDVDGHRRWLVGLLVHIGTAMSGHYIAICRRMGQWYLMSDSQVNAVRDGFQGVRWYLEGSNGAQVYLAVFTSDDPSAAAPDESESAGEMDGIDEVDVVDPLDGVGRAGAGRAGAGRAAPAGPAQQADSAPVAVDVPKDSIPSTQSGAKPSGRKSRKRGLPVHEPLVVPDYVSSGAPTPGTMSSTQRRTAVVFGSPTIVGALVLPDSEAPHPWDRHIKKATVAKMQQVSLLPSLAGLLSEAVIHTTCLYYLYCMCRCST